MKGDKKVLSAPCSRHPDWRRLDCFLSGPCRQERRTLRTFERHARALERAYPDAGPPRRSIGFQEKGADARRGKRKVSDTTLELIRDEVRRLVENDNESRNNACRRVSEKHGLSKATVLRYTRPE